MSREALEPNEGHGYKVMERISEAITAAPTVEPDFLAGWITGMLHDHYLLLPSDRPALEAKVAEAMRSQAVSPSKPLTDELARIAMDAIFGEAPPTDGTVST